MKTAVKKIILIAILALTLPAIASADLTARVEKILNRQSQKKAQFAVKILKADSGKTLYAKNADKPMIPASNMKIVTTAAALKILGPDYKFKTQVGLCDNNLVVIGSGDPLLGDKDTDSKYNRPPGWIFDDIISKLTENSITSINDIIIDTSIFDDQRVHLSWPPAQLNQWYACEVSGVNYNRNCINMTTKTKSGKVSIYIEPQTDYIKIINKVRPITKGKSAVGAYRNTTPNTLIVKGKCKTKQGPFAVAIERPAAFFGYLLYENLSKASIQTNGQLLESPIDPKCRFKKLTEYSTSITDCLNRSNKNSLGLAAESLMKTIAANTNGTGKNGSWHTGADITGQYLSSLSVPADQFYIDDASGLSRKNMLSPNAITKVLLDRYKSKNWQIYKDSLAVGGVDGTIAKYFKEEKYKGKIFGKTGYIAGVKSFSGTCTTKSGDYIFSIIVNSANGKSRPAINDIAKAIFEPSN